MANVRVIPATIQHRCSAQTASLTNRRRAAAYARVSTDKDEQETSFEAQVDYYTKYIQERPDWEFIKVYTDDGLSGCTTKNREGFNQMVADGLSGKFDLLVTKSVSRFARNTVDSLTTIRKLKEVGCEVYFEKEAIWSFDGKGELLITIMSSLAQEEARNISENVTWGQRKRFSDGKVSLPYKQFLGYRKGEDGLPEIVEEEAEIVRLIFRFFIDGKTPSTIARYLVKHGIPSPAGKKNWQVATIRSILTNEKYAGQALLQKQFTTNFLTKSRKKNEGEIPQYFVEESHPAIIKPEDFDDVQAEITRRNALGRPMGCNSPFSAKIVCGQCSGYFGPKVWGSYKNDKSRRRVIWQCNDKYTRPGKPGKGCKTPALNEDDIKKRFVEAWSNIAANREELISDCRAAKKALCDHKDIDAELTELQREIEVVTELSRKAIYENAHSAVNQEEFQSRNSGYLERHRAATERFKALEEIKRQRQNKARIIGTFIRNLADSPTVMDEFSETIWAASVDRVTVTEDGKLIFRFRDGTEIEG